jgi:hypothetical protein
LPIRIVDAVVWHRLHGAFSRTLFECFRNEGD